MHFRIINKLNKSVRQTFCVLMSQNIKDVYPVLWGMIFLLNYFVSINRFQPFCRMGFGYMDFSNYEHIPYYYFHNITSSFKIL